MLLRPRHCHLPLSRGQMQLIRPQAASDAGQGILPWESAHPGAQTCHQFTDTLCPHPSTSFHRLWGSSLPSWGLLTLLTDPAVATGENEVTVALGRGLGSLRRACLMGGQLGSNVCTRRRCVSSARSQDQLYRHN